MSQIKRILKENAFTDKELRLIACNLVESFLYRSSKALDFIDAWDIRSESQMDRSILDQVIRTSRNYAEGLTSFSDLQETHAEAVNYVSDWRSRSDGMQTFLGAIQIVLYVAAENIADAIGHIVTETELALSYSYLEADYVFQVMQLRENQARIIKEKRGYVTPVPKKKVLSPQIAGFLVGLNTSLLISRNSKNLETTMYEMIHSVRAGEYDKVVSKATLPLTEEKRT